jgi:hypothetical protein
LQTLKIFVIIYIEKINKEIAVCFDKLQRRLDMEQNKEYINSLLKDMTPDEIYAEARRMHEAQTAASQRQLSEKRINAVDALVDYVAFLCNEDIDIETRDELIKYLEAQEKRIKEYAGMLSSFTSPKTEKKPTKNAIDWDSILKNM